MKLRGVFSSGQEGTYHAADRIRPRTAAGSRRAGHDSLPALIERHRRAGLEISLAAEPIPPQLLDTVHRIVQESLTNVLRHSDARRARVIVTVDDGSLTVLVGDDGRPVPDRASDGRGGGFGPAGSRSACERSAAR